MSALAWPVATQSVKFGLLHRITCSACGMEQYTADVHHHFFAAIITVCPGCGCRELQLTCPEGCDEKGIARGDPQANAPGIAPQQGSGVAVSLLQLNMPAIPRNNSEAT